MTQMQRQMKNMLTTLPAAHTEISSVAYHRIFKAPTFLNAQTASLFLQWLLLFLAKQYEHSVKLSSMTV